MEEPFRLEHFMAAEESTLDPLAFLAYFTDNYNRKIRTTKHYYCVWCRIHLFFLTVTKEPRTQKTR